MNELLTTETRKRCVQCMQQLPQTDAYFRAYSYRGQGKISSKRGRSTVCKECESYNQIATRAYKKDLKNESDIELLDVMKAFYDKCIEDGGTPKGVYANSLYRTNLVDAPRDAVLNRLKERMSNGDQAMKEFQTLLDIPLTESPEHYDDLHTSVRLLGCGIDGKLHDKYKDINDKVLERLNDYEDAYDASHN